MNVIRAIQYYLPFQIDNGYYTDEESSYGGSETTVSTYGAPSSMIYRSVHKQHPFRDNRGDLRQDLPIDGRRPSYTPQVPRRNYNKRQFTRKQLFCLWTLPIVLIAVVMALIGVFVIKGDYISIYIHIY